MGVMQGVDVAKMAERLTDRSVPGQCTQQNVFAKPSRQGWFGANKYHSQSVWAEDSKMTMRWIPWTASEACGTNCIKNRSFPQKAPIFDLKCDLCKGKKLLMKRHRIIPMNPMNSAASQWIFLIKFMPVREVTSLIICQWSRLEEWPSNTSYREFWEHRPSRLNLSRELIKMRLILFDGVLSLELNDTITQR